MSRIVEKLEMEKKSDTSIEQEKMEEDPDRFHLGGFPNLENIDRAENVVIQGSRDTDSHYTSSFQYPLKLAKNNCWKGYKRRKCVETMNRCSFLKCVRPQFFGPIEPIIGSTLVELAPVYDSLTF